jgi:hypothetical protein
VLDVQTKDVSVKKVREDKKLEEGQKDGEKSSLYVHNDEESILLEQPAWTALDAKE